jgi:hypothetical protein
MTGVRVWWAVVANGFRTCYYIIVIVIITIVIEAVEVEPFNDTRPRCRYSKIDVNANNNNLCNLQSQRVNHIIAIYTYFFFFYVFRDR